MKVGSDLNHHFHVRRQVFAGLALEIVGKLHISICPYHCVQSGYRNPSVILLDEFEVAMPSRHPQVGGFGSHPARLHT